MANLLKETLKKLKEIGKSVQDIEWIGSKDGKYACTWKEFEKLADKEYDDGFGSQEVASDLVIVFKDGSWLERGEYDGSEWWEYKKPPRKKEKTKKIKYLFVFERGKIGGATLEELHKGDFSKQD